MIVYVPLSVHKTICSSYVQGGRVIEAQMVNMKLASTWMKNCTAIVIWQVLQKKKPFRPPCIIKIKAVLGTYQSPYCVNLMFPFFLFRVFFNVFVF